MTDKIDKKNRIVEVASSESELMSNKELIQELYNIASRYKSLNEMCAKSIELKTQKRTDLYLILDAAIALQIYQHISKNKKNEALNLIKKTFSKLSEI